MNADHTIGHRWHLRHTMRAASSGKQGIKRVSDEGDIAYATDQTANLRICLTGRKIIHGRRADTVGIDLGDAGASDATFVRPSTSGLFAAASSRVRTANSPFG